MGIKSFFENLYNKLKNNNTLNIIILYINLIFYKILPLLIPLSLIGYSNIFVNIVRYVIVIYLIINLLISDFILRQSIKIRNLVEAEHSCNMCSNNVVWNLQDLVSNIVFYILGGFVFKYNMYLDIYWRCYTHTLPICIKNKLCVQKSVELQYQSIPFGILNYLIELSISYIFPFEYTLIMMFFITFVIDCVIFNLDIKYQSNISFVNVLLQGVWKVSQCVTIGYMENKKRKIANRDVVEEIINWLNYLRTNTWYRVILWKEFQNLDNFISWGNTSVFYREHILAIHEILITVVNYLDNDPKIKMARRTKILHIGTIFKPFMSSQNKFYIRMFESRKSLEPFIKQLLKDLDVSISNTKSEGIYEEMYNFEKKIDSQNVKIIESFYSNGQ
jgi:hypothetical protein